MNINGKRTIYSNCNGLDDGYYDIEVIPNEIMNVQCSNEYMIVDISHDETWYNLFSSFKQYHEHIIGPVMNDHVNWESFIPSLQIDHFLVSPYCTICNAESSLNSGLYQDHTAYYMNQVASGCFHKNRGLPACDMDRYTYQCKICQWTEGTVISRPYSSIHDYTDDDNTGICAFSIRPSNFAVATQFSQCFNYQTSAFKPSLGTNGKYCQCIKSDAPNNHKMIHKYEQDNDIIVQSDRIINDIIYLYQSDFYDGTYRIVNGGTYVIMEDIEFDFNANMDDPNGVGSYMPSCDDIDRYPGSCSTSGPYHMGFFAGITIETTEGVILDLNDHCIGMSIGYFYQQGFFSVISLGSQPFEPMHGFNFGVNPKWAQHVVIKNGIIGRSSHHGIHGNNNKNIEIINVRVKYFVTHGIQLNGFSHITLKDIDIGPSNTEITLNANYVQMRALLNNLRTLYNKEEIKDKTFSFSGRKDDVLTLRELVEDRLIPIMNNAFKLSVFGNGVFDKNMVVFLNTNDNMIPYAAVVYGLFLNYPSSGIFGWHVSDEESNGITIDNIYIHDLYHSSQEIIGLTVNRHGISNSLNGPLSAISLIGNEMMHHISQVISSKRGTFNAPYIGDIVTDIHFAYYVCAQNDWDLWDGTPYYGDNGELVKWAFGDPHYKDIISSDKIKNEEDLNELITCNGDGMQHPLKGIIGIKISGVKNVEFKGSLVIDNLYDSSELGSMLCGPYDKANFGQQLPYSLGFSGNMVHALDVSFSDININTERFKISNIISSTGLSYGLSIWYKTNIWIKNMDFNIQNVVAGNKYLNEETFIFNEPNHSPKACGIRIHESDVFPVIFSFEGDDESIFKQQCIEGIIGCDQNEDILFTHIGTVNNDANQCADLRSEQILDTNLYHQVVIHYYFIIIFVVSFLIISIIGRKCCITHHQTTKYVNVYGTF